MFFSENSEDMLTINIKDWNVFFSTRKYDCAEQETDKSVIIVMCSFMVGFRHTQYLMVPPDTVFINLNQSAFHAET